MEKSDRSQSVRRSSRARHSASISNDDQHHHHQDGEQVAAKSPAFEAESQQQPSPSASLTKTGRRNARRSSTEAKTSAKHQVASTVSQVKLIGATSAAQTSPSDRSSSNVVVEQTAIAYPYTLRARASDQSEISSSGTSQRAWSPVSTPATPATVHSVANSVSSSLVNTREDDQQDESVDHQDRHDAGAALDVNSSSSSSSSDTRVDRKGKGRARTPPRSSSSSTSKANASRTIKTSTGASSPSNVSAAATKGKKRAKTSTSPEPASTTIASKRSKVVHSTDADQSRYPLRSRVVTMAPPRKPAVSSASAKAKAQAGTKTRSTRTTATSTSTPSCSRSSDRMDVDDDDGMGGGGGESVSESFAEVNDLPSASDHDVIEDDEMHSARGDEEDEEEDEEHRIAHLSGIVDEEEGDEVFDDDDEEEEDDEGQYDEDEEGLDDPYGDEGDEDDGAGGFTSQLRAMAGYMSGLSGRFRTLLASIRNRHDPTAQLVALQELSEVLSISNEDTLAGYFPTDTFVAELIFLMGGPKPARSGMTKGKITEETQSDRDEEDALLAISAAFENNSEIMLLACRCLANLIEAMPYAANSVISHGALPVLNSKLVEIEFIDLAEQVLQTLEKISIEYPSAIVREGGLSIMLQYLDFFNIYVQRTAMNAAANCCRRLSSEHFDKAKEVMPIIQNVLSYSDQRLVESACRCIVRLTDSYRHHGDLLEQLLTHDVVGAVNAVLLPGSDPASNSTNVNPSTYTDVLKALGTAARVSPAIAVTLLEKNIVETLYVLLTGSSSTSEKPVTNKDSSDALDLSSGLDSAAIAVVSADGTGDIGMADVAILQNLAQRPKDQVHEALTLIAELLPPLPRDGIFNPRTYNERALAKRRARASKRNEAQSSASKVQASPTHSVEASDSAVAEATTTTTTTKPERVKAEREIAKEKAQMRRVAALRERGDLVKRFTDLVMPTLVDVYAASVGYSVRSKSLYGILKLVNFVDSAPLLESLDNVPLASFIASVLSSRDHAILVQGALQLVELLTVKLPDVYSALLRREGVMWEIEDIASREPSAKSSSAVTKDGKEKAKPESESSTTAAEGSNVDDGTRLPSSNLSRLLAANNVLSGSAIVGNTLSSASQIPSMLTTLSGHSMSATDAEDSNIWRARMLCETLSPEASDASAGGAHEAGRALGEIQGLVKSLQDESESSSEDTLRTTLDKIAQLFCKADNPISSFEMVRSGLVDGLHDFATGDSDLLPTDVRCNLLISAFMRDYGTDGKTNVAASALVRRLQETLSRLEDVEIMTTIYNEEDARRSATANVARQVRLKLVAESDQGGQELPRSCNNIVVSIHAITSFRSLHDYLRPKIAASQALSSGSSMSSSMPRSISGLSGMLETLASSAGIEMSAALREHLRAAATASGGGESATQNALEGERQPATTTTTRRRSSRLSVKDVDQSKKGGEEEPKTDEAKASSSEAAKQSTAAGGEGEIDDALARRLVEGLMEEDLDDLEGNEGFSDEYEDGFVMDEDDMTGLGGAPSIGTAGDETIQLDVTPEEKRDAATEDEAGKLSQSAPNTLPSQSSPSKGASSSSSNNKASYASALQKPPIDWHLQFEVDGRKVGLDSTIYSAIHRHEMQLRSQPGHSTQLASRASWTSSYTVKFRKVSGPEPKSSEDEMSGGDDELDRLRTPDMVDSNTPYTRILQLLRVFYNLNREWRESSTTHAFDAAQPLSESAFVNNKLTAKLNRQLEEPMIVASKCLPSWALILPRRFSFLFPFEARFAFLQSTSFGYHRLISRWQMRQTRDQQAAGATSSARNDGSLALLGRLTRQKVRISRSNILASATKVFELYGANSSLLEVEYFDEVGTGLGPTLEFYAMVSKDFAKKSTKMWRIDESRDTDKNEFVVTASGLFPAPIDHLELASSAGRARVQLFRVLGQFVAKAQFDSRIIDLNFSSLFMRAILGQGIPCTLDMLGRVDEALARSLRKLRTMSSDELDGLMLDFTMPGYAAYELHAHGKDETVSSANVEQYIDEVVTHTLQTGVRPFVEAFQTGFNLIFPITAMHTFTPDELAMLFGNQEEDWDEKTLMASIKPDHGYNADSPTFRNVISVMASFSTTERRDFLQWLTGSPKLPVGGFMGLHPQLTIVKRPPDANQVADQTLPSVMTCVNFCKMPPFSTREVMRKRLLVAMQEGQASFHLS